MRCAYCGEPVYEEDRVILYDDMTCPVIVHEFCAVAYKDDHETRPKVKG